MKRFIKIKQMIFKIEAKTGEWYILKGHFHPARVKRQWDFFDCMDNKEALVPFILFPNGSKTIADGRVTWTISPYRKGRTLKYEDEADRKRALHATRTFHSYAKNIQLKNQQVTKVMSERMQKRFYRFTQSASIFHEYGYDRLYTEIYKVSANLLESAFSYPWHEKMNLAKKNGRWIHGDVASHNFIHDETTVLIDFDLLATAPQIYDYMQLGQRFLPYIDWNLDALLAYQMVDDHDLPIWLTMIGLPSDVMREWHITIAKKNINTKEYLQKMGEDWAQRKIFLRNVHSMLQSK
ncbi:phosphotransferase [Virgibacillus halophilus]|uniref:phosphotransferase n=1 Tax=Tigheibacillus halophilus TaxID=361280 RepID=UPI0036F388A1